MRTLLLTACCLPLLCACSTAPQLIVPDGRQRAPANRPDAIARYRWQQQQPAQQQETQQQASLAPGPTAQERRIESLERQLHALRQQFAPTASTQPPAGPTGAVLDGAELILGPGSAVFRLPQPLGKVSCQAAPAINAALLRTALLSRRIEIRGHTDAAYGDALNRRLAMQRALCARRLLLAAGVQPQRIRTSYHAAGAFIEENRSTQGKARNRRVEVELQGVAADALAALATVGGVAPRSTP